MKKDILDIRNLKKFIVNHRIYYDDVWAYAEEESLDEKELDILLDSLEARHITVVYREVKEDRVVNEHSALTIYLYQTAAMPLLNREEMDRLCEIIRRGRMNHACEEEKEAAQVARTQMIVCNLRLVVMIARRMKIAYRYKSLEDMIQEGNIGLMRSLDKYDYKMGYRFSTYAGFWIKREIFRSCIESSRVIRMPHRTMESISKIQSKTREFRLKNGRDPTFQELVEITGFRPRRIQECQKALLDPLSLNMVIGTGSDRNTKEDTTLEDFLSDPNAVSVEDQVESILHKEEMVWKKKELFEKMRQLTPMEQYVLWHRYGFDGEGKVTCRELGEQLGITRQAVNKTEQTALRKLRVMYNVVNGKKQAQAISQEG